MSKNLNVLFSSQGVMIRRLSVPRWVRNGTDTPVVLDCEYVYNENDLKLVVKWFFNDGLEPVYQWIPEMKVREAFGVLQGRLDDTYSVNSRDDYSQYRAIRILRPTKELSGKYTCVVASLAGQDARYQDMTVFVPAKSFSFNYSGPSNADQLPQPRTVGLLCTGRGLYPKPELKLFLIKGGRRKPVGEAGVRTFTRASSEGLFDVVLHADMAESQLPSLADVFECVLEIPYSNYVLTRRMSLTHEWVISPEDAVCLCEECVIRILTHINR
ncbi:hypothetical protein HPB48_004059 [Haemaphysalis longicornis]|uniref:Ig-like domain-containing protein n=1 Tax=Haemaphysalis longicornis TaxID=44386 RepID=A0A9J6FQU1_HAELO|nr:hypothetical protein HPB48_004059 [Haemaphysalis longicornis]